LHEIALFFGNGMLESVKGGLEKLTGYARPAKAALAGLVRARKPHLYHFADDGYTPNNPTLPLVLYRTPLKLDARFDPAAIVGDAFAAHGWRDSWRDGMYDFLHFHTRAHEVLGLARGYLRAQFGGEKGKILRLKAGDVVILPAGTGHKRLSQSRDLLVVGAYPATGDYDEPRPSDVSHDKAVASIAKVRLPAKDPVYGSDGPLKRVWRK
jgi:uncharacterized protein YjlB